MTPQHRQRSDQNPLALAHTNEQLQPEELSSHWYPFTEGDLRELQVTCQDHMEVKHQLQGNYENYLSGYLHSKADESTVLLLQCCSSLESFYHE